MAEGSRAECAPLLHVVILRQGRYAGGLAFQLPSLTQDDLRTAIVFLHLAVNLDQATLQLSHVPYLPQIAGKYHNREGTSAEVLAEVEIVDAFYALLYSEDLAGYTLRFAKMLACLESRDAISVARA